MVAREEALNTPLEGSKLAQLNSNMASVTPAWSSVAAVPVWVSRVPHSGDEVGTGAALALNESARARPARARAAAIATLTLVTLRVRLRTATARNSFAVLLNFLSRAMALSLSRSLHILSVN